MEAKGASRGRVSSGVVQPKGASRGRVSSGVVQHARNDQLDNIAEVSYDGGRSYDVVKDGIKKCVACSAFKHEPYGSVWELSDVDPVGRGEATISFDLDRALYCYYEPVVSPIASGGCKEAVDRNGNSVVVAVGDHGKACLKASVWKACSSRKSVDDAKGLTACPSLLGNAGRGRCLCKDSRAAYVGETIFAALKMVAGMSRCFDPLSNAPQKTVDAAIGKIASVVNACFGIFFGADPGDRYSGDLFLQVTSFAKCWHVTTSFPMETSALLWLCHLRS